MIPNPGGIRGHKIVIDGINDWIYVFGGFGFDSSGSEGNLY